MTFALEWQDFTGWRSADPSQPFPKKQRQLFDDKDRALAHKAALKASNPNIVACVVDVSEKGSRVTKRSMSQSLAAAGMPEFHTGMKLKP